MDEMPVSPRERLLRESDEVFPEGVDTPPSAEQESGWLEEEKALAEDVPFKEPEEPMILTVIELEKQLERLDQIQEALQGSNRFSPEAYAAADDALQGSCVVLGMTYQGDVQMLVLAILSRYREIKGLR